MPADPVIINKLKEAFLKITKNKQKPRLWRSKLKCHQKLL